MDRLFPFFAIWKKHGRREGFVIMDLVWIFSGVFWWKEMVATAMSTSDICMRILVMIGQESDIRSDTDKDYENVIVIILDNANGTPTATQMFSSSAILHSNSQGIVVYLYRSIYLSTYHYYLRIDLSTYLSLYLPTHLPIHNYLHMYLSIDLSIQKELYLSINTIRFNQKPSKPPNGGFRK